MKRTIYYPLFAVLLAVVMTSELRAQGAGIVTYQGRVQSGGSDFTGTGQFKFALVTVTNTAVTATAAANPPSGGFITVINVTFGGSGYVTPPVVALTGGGGSGAIATASVSGGAVTSITVNNPGSGYASAPTVTVAPPPESLAFTTYWSNDGTSSAGSEPATAVSVPVNSGLFIARLGDPTVANMTVLPVNLFSEPNLHLRLWFDDGMNGFAVLQPTQPLSAAPYAFTAMAARSLTGTLPAAQLSGTIPSANVNGVYSGNLNFNNADNSFTGSGAGLTALNASQLTSGTVPVARLSANVALLSAPQTFTASKSFSSGAQILADVGNVSAPGYGFAGDLDTGLFNPSANAFAIATGGAERFRVNSLGNVGIGVTVPVFRLDVRDASTSVNSMNIQRLADAATGSDLVQMVIGAGSSDDAQFIECERGTDFKFRVWGDGDVTADGTFTGGGADYAELLEQMDADEKIEPGDVVGVFGGRITKFTRGAAQVMVISTKPLLVGNASAEERSRQGWAKVAFVGQTPMKVSGPVQSGDLLLASSAEDGTAIAVAPGRLVPEQCRLIVGIAWESSADAGIKKVNALVGIGQTSAMEAMLRAALRTTTELEQRLTALEKRFTQQTAAHSGSLR